MTRKIELAVNEIFHVYNRGVDGRFVFLDESHFCRFYESMYLFNDVCFENTGGGWTNRMAELNTMRMTGVDIRKRLVDIVAFNLMDNHLHLELVPLIDNGVPKFMHKLQMSHAKFMNLELARRGSLFERPFSAKHVDDFGYADFLPVYIHLNGFDRFGVPWREGLVENWETALALLNQHKWSSHGIAMGKKQDLPVVTEKYLRDVYPSTEKYLEHLKQWSTRFRGQLEKADSLMVL